MERNHWTRCRRLPEPESTSNSALTPYSVGIVPLSVSSSSWHFLQRLDSRNVSRSPKVMGLSQREHFQPWALAWVSNVSLIARSAAMESSASRAIVLPHGLPIWDRIIQSDE